MILFTRLYKNLTIIEVVKNLLASIGILWGLLEVTAFFGGDEFSKAVKPYWWLFLIFGAIYTLISCFPKNKFTFKIPNRDSKVILHLKNAFDIEKSSIIIPINNLIKVNPAGHLNTSTSMLSQFVKLFYDSKSDNLQHEIDKELAKPFYSNYRNGDEYKIGTVVPIRANDRQFYLVANSTLNDGRRSVATKDGLEASLNELWIYLSDNAGKEHFIIPILGTGRGRINMTREEVIKETILSFLASCSDKNYADKLTISINPNDIKEHNLDLEGIVKWTEAKVKYVDYQKRTFTNGTNVLT